MNLSNDLHKKFDGLAQAVMKKPASALSAEELTTLILMDIHSLPNTLRVDVTSTRKTEVQFCTNQYGGSVTMDLTDMKRAIVDDVLGNGNPTAESLVNYLSKKAIFIDFLRFKFSSMEGALRDMCREQEKKDRISPIGRYSDE